MNKIIERHFYRQLDFPFFPDFSSGRDPKIVGGVDAYIEDIPYQVSLRRLVQNETYASWGLVDCSSLTSIVS